MKHIHKIGLLVLSEDQTRFLMCVKHGLDALLFPGGKIENGETDTDCLIREIREELDTGVDTDSLEFIGEYTDVPAGNPDALLTIRLYRGRLLGTPQPTSEIKELHWLTSADHHHPLQSPIVVNKIFPDLLDRGIFK